MAPVVNNPFVWWPLSLTLALNACHVGIHLWTTLVRKADTLPWYDPWVGYAGALAWYLMVIFDRRTLGWSLALAVPSGVSMTASGLCVHGMGIRDMRRRFPGGEYEEYLRGTLF